jgi:hypothetical protein
MLTILLESKPVGPTVWIGHGHGTWVAQKLEPFLQALYAHERIGNFQIEVGAFAAHYIKCAEEFADGNVLLCKFLLVRFRMLFESWGWNQTSELAEVQAQLTECAKQLAGNIPDLVPNKEGQDIRGMTVERFLQKIDREVAVA